MLLPFHLSSVQIRIVAIFFVLVLVNGLIACGEDDSEIPDPKDETADTNGTTLVEGTAKGLVILVEYPDVKHTVDREYAQTRFDRLNTYVEEMSYGKLSIDTDVTEKWYEMPNPVSYYEIAPRNLEVDKSKVENLIQDAIDAAESDVDFTKYDFTAIFMSARIEEYGMIGLCGYPGMLGWTADKIPVTKSGVTIQGGVTIFCYHAHLGTLFHDTGHVLGGVRDGKRVLPCLYDHDLQALPGPLRETAIDAMINMGFWDPMSCHFYDADLPPPGVSSWTKLRMNWIDESKLEIIRPGVTELQLGPLENDTSDILAVKIPLSETTFYLIENRQPIGIFDEILPGSGILIMYADNEIAECRHGQAPVKLVDADPSVPHLEGAAFDIGKRDSFEDSENGLTIKLLEKIGDSYRISIDWQK